MSLSSLVRRGALALAALSLCACAADPSAPPDESFLDGRDEAPTRSVGSAPNSYVSEGELTSHWDALVHRHLSTTEGRAFRLKEFHRTDRFSVSVLGVASSLPAPTRQDRTELLLIVEGERGVVTMSGERYRVGAGSVAVFPPGSRGEILANTGDPLIGLLITTDAPCPPDTRPFLSSFERLWGDETFAINQDASDLLMRIPGVLSLHGYTVYGYLPPHYHAESDSLLFVIQGEGSFGLGSAGNLYRDGSVMAAPTNSPHYMKNRDVRGTRVLVLHGIDLGEGGTTMLEGYAAPLPGAPGSEHQLEDGR